MTSNNKIKVLVCAFACLKNPDTRFGFGDGGEGVLGWNIVLQLNRFFDVSVLTHSDNRAAIEEKIAVSKVTGIDFYYLKLPAFLNFTKRVMQIYAYLWQIKAYFVARKLNKGNGFDVFHHVTYANDWMASFIGALLPIPYVRGPGGGAHRVPKRFVDEYSIKQRAAEKIRSIGQWVFKRDFFFIIGNNRAKAILVCNKEAFDALPRKWQKKSYFFPVNGISAEDLKLLDLHKEKIRYGFSVLTVGKLVKLKGFDMAIKAFKIFSDKVLEAKLVIVGKGPEINNLENLVAEFDIKDKVVFEGWLSREEVLKKMSLSDVFLFASLRDGGGAVVVEAMAAGKPVICFDLAGPGLHIDEKCGIKIRPDSPGQAVRDMATALEKLYFSEDLRLSLGKEARKKAEREYDLDKLGNKLNEIYKNIL
ncbi:MAG: glycosyltransferase [Candidatus Paceibacterota bacterium]